jgi:hypothetical protein
MFGSGLSYARTATSLLVLSLNQIVMQAQDVSDTQPLMLDSTEPRRNDFRSIRPLS